MIHSPHTGTPEDDGLTTRDVLKSSSSGKLSIALAVAGTTSIAFEDSLGGPPLPIPGSQVCFAARYDVVIRVFACHGELV